MPLRIRVSNQNKKKKINTAGVKKAALSVLRSFRRNNAIIDITFVSRNRIKTLNKKYMGRKGATDVISFLLEERLVSGRALLGDIYISSDVACENSARFETDFPKEILLYTVHGVLHLLGFGDKTRKEKNKIRRLEEKFLKKIWHR